MRCKVMAQPRSTFFGERSRQPSPGTHAPDPPTTPLRPIGPAPCLVSAQSPEETAEPIEGACPELVEGSNHPISPPVAASATEGYSRARSGCGAPAEPGPTPDSRPSTPDESTRLALAWRAGDRAALTLLYQLLRPLTLAALK